MGRWMVLSLFILTISSGELKADNLAGTKKLRDAGVVFSKGKIGNKLITFYMNCTQRIIQRMKNYINSINDVDLISIIILMSISKIIYPISVQVNQHKNCRLPLSISINSLPLKSVVCKIQHSSRTKVLSNYVCFVDVHKTQLTKLAVKLKIFFLNTADYFFCFETDVNKNPLSS